MGAKPDPSKFEILLLTHRGQNTIVEARYEGCLTFGGRKLMVLRGHHDVDDLPLLDPHFLEGHIVAARFEPTAQGWQLAKLVAYNLSPHA